MNDICFELSLSCQSDFDTTPVNLESIRHRQWLLPVIVYTGTAGRSSRKCQSVVKTVIAQSTSALQAAPVLFELLPLSSATPQPHSSRRTENRSAASVSGIPTVLGA